MEDSASVRELEDFSEVHQKKNLSLMMQINIMTTLFNHQLKMKRDEKSELCFCSRNPYNLV